MTLSPRAGLLILAISMAFTPLARAELATRATLAAASLREIAQRNLRVLKGADDASELVVLRRVEDAGQVRGKVGRHELALRRQL